MNAEGSALALALAVALDMMIGDPRWLPHPVRWMGRAIEALEPRFRRLPLRPLVSGALMATLLVASVWGGCLLLIHIAASIHPAAGILVETAMIYACICARSLADAALAVSRALAESGIAAGRRAVSMIVGREVDRLDETGRHPGHRGNGRRKPGGRHRLPAVLRRAGRRPPGHGLQDGQHPGLHGRVPERPLSAVRALRRPHGRCGQFHPCPPELWPSSPWPPSCSTAVDAPRMGTAWRDGRAHASPNAGYPEAAFAGALGLWMGGPNRYHGRLVEKPVIGKRSR
jgi:adenosylcobinamide-phosphate synthase